VDVASDGLTARGRVLTVAARQEGVWELQGQKPRGLSEVRSALTRLKRLGAWFLGEYCARLPPEQMTAVLVRLQTLSIYADYHTRCAAVTALCKVATVIDSLEVKASVYEFLHSLEVAEFDLHICPDVNVSDLSGGE
jgi:hypothetical protein